MALATCPSYSVSARPGQSSLDIAKVGEGVGFTYERGADLNKCRGWNYIVGQVYIVNVFFSNNDQLS